MSEEHRNVQESEGNYNNAAEPHAHEDYPPPEQENPPTENGDYNSAGGAMRRSSVSGGRGGHSNSKPYDRPATQKPSGSGGKECRVYVGNLPYSLKWWDLKDFCREAGEVIRAEVLMLPNGRSKGCGIVEYSSPEEARKAIQLFQNRQLQGRPIFVREDREEALRISRPPVMGPGSGAGRPYGGPVFGRPSGGVFTTPVGPPNPRMVFVQNLPYSCSWQNLKDLFRQAGTVDKADVLVYPDTGRSRGVGTVVFDSEAAAQKAISMFNGYDYYGRKLEVREDRGRAPRGPPGGLGPRYPSTSSPCYNSGYGQQPYDQSGYDQQGYGAAAYDQNGYGSSGGYDQSGYDQTGYGTGYDQGGYGNPGYDQSGYQQNAGYDDYYSRGGRY